MALTPSNMLALGTKAPDFKLLDTQTGVYKTLQKLKGKKGTVILFICNHCPFVIHLNKTLVHVADKYQSKGINFIAISSNDPKQYPQDGPEKMGKHAKENKYNFPYLFDQTQEIAKKYEAACTPDIYLFDEHLKLQYRGQFDDSRPNNGIAVTGKDLIYAMECLKKNNINTKLQKPSIGCNIKWR